MKRNNKTEKKIIYTDEPIHSRKSKDFLPPPEKFVIRKRKTKL